MLVHSTVRNRRRRTHVGLGVPGYEPCVWGLYTPPAETRCPPGGAGQAAPSAATANGAGQAGLLAALVRRRRLPAAVSAAARAGAVQLDDAQRDYLHALLGEPVSNGAAASGSASGAERSLANSPDRWHHCVICCQSS